MSDLRNLKVEKGIGHECLDSLSRINEILDMKDAINASVGRLDRLCDLSMIGRLYAFYQKLSADSGFKADIRNGNRKQFLLAILMLYSPASLAGGMIPKQLRHEIAEALGIRYDHMVYEMRGKAVAWYRTYASFREETDIAYSQLLLESRAHH